MNFYFPYWEGKARDLRYPVKIENKRENVYMYMCMCVGEYVFVCWRV